MCFIYFATSPLRPTIPLLSTVSPHITGFTLGMTTDDLNAQCKAWGYTVGSNDCGYLFNTYNVTLSAQHTVMARNNQSKLFACSASRWVILSQYLT